MMKRLKSLTFIFLISLIFSTHSFANYADTILTNGNILTLDKDFSSVNSLAIADGKILAVGSADSINQYKGPNTQTIELAGKTVIPGLIDNHFHFVRSVWNYQYEVRLDGLNSKEKALALIRKRSQSISKGKWITVIGGWTNEQFLDNSKPFTLSELDAAAPDNPVFMMQTYSTAYANTTALKAVNMRASSARVKGRDKVKVFTNEVSWYNKSSNSSTILAYMQVLNQMGITSVYDVGRESDGKLAPVEALAQQGLLPVRVFHSLRYTARNTKTAKAAISLIKSGDHKPLSNSDQFGLIGLGEHIYNPVYDSTRTKKSWPNNIWGPFSDIARAGAESGWSIHEHIKSKTTAKQFIELVEDIAEDTPNVTNLRWTIAHANGMDEGLLEKAYKLGIALAIHSQSMMSSSTRNAPPLGSIQRSGVLWGLGSDAAVVAPYNPFLTLGWVVTGQNIAGGTGWNANQRISRKDALIAHTISNAKLLFMEDKLGSLEVGKLADIVVLDKDIMTIPETEIASISPVMTMTSGKVVFNR